MEKRREEPNVSAPMQFRTPDKNKIVCAKCAFRDKGENGECKITCEVFPEGKDLAILFENADCDYMVEEE